MTADTPSSPPPSVVDAGVGRLAATVERLREEVRDAQHSAGGRALVELATGVLAERLGLTVHQAGLQLHALADRSGSSPLEVAADLIAQAAKAELAQVTRDFLARTALPAEEAPSAWSAAESAVTSAPDAVAVCASLLEYALPPLGAVAVALWSTAADGSLDLAGSAGFTPVEAQRWRYVPPTVAVFARAALTERRAIWQSSPVEALPSVGRTELPHGSRIALPVGSGGRLLGVLEICWPDQIDPQPVAVHRQLESLAELCAHTLDNRPPLPFGAPSALVALADVVLDSAMVLQPVLGGHGSVVDFRIQHLNERFTDLAGRPRAALGQSTFLEAYPLAARDGGIFEQLQYVFATGEPLSAARTQMITMVDRLTFSGVTDYSIARHDDELLVTWRIHDESARLADLLQHAQRLGRIGGFEENLASGEIIWNAQLFELHGRDPEEGPVPLRALARHAHSDDTETIERFLRALTHHRHPASTSFRLQRPDRTYRHLRVVAEPVLDAHSRLIGIRGAYQDVSAQHWTEIALEAARDQLTLTQQAAEEQNQLTLQLQRAIMPPTSAPLAPGGGRAAVRYRPSGSGHLVGGDWYDVFALPSGKAIISIGDIAGHGIQAATDMVVLRNALRGLSATGAGPAQLLSWLNSVTYNLTDEVTATAVCGVFDPADRTFRWARAGHPSPLLLRGDDAATLPLLDGVLLGLVDDVRYTESVVELQPDDRLLLYTDGLFEHRDLSYDEALAHLLKIAPQPGLDLSAHADRLLTRSSSDTDDDTCVIALQVSSG